MMRDIAVAILADHQNVMLAVAARTRQAVWDGDHLLHGNNHARYGSLHGVQDQPRLRSNGRARRAVTVTN